VAQQQGSALGIKLHPGAAAHAQQGGRLGRRDAQITGETRLQGEAQLAAERWR
jgi:hypothetical protein